MSKQNKQAEEVKETSDNKKQKLPASVIAHYSKYRSPKINIKSFLVMGTRFEVEDKYEIIDSVGQGAYGIVVAARDKTHQGNEESLVAIKKIEKAFEHKIFTKRTLRELKILRLLQHENIIDIKTIMLPKSRETFEDIYVYNELMETDLASIIKSPQALSDEHIQFFLYQILRGLKYIHSAGIIHRDLKPRNLLVNSNCDLKICDFGLSRAIHYQQKTGDMTDYVATRWYRAPELLLAAKEYGPSVDMWSVGCILAELLKRKPFLPGTETKTQLELIIDVFGNPTDEEINSIPKEKSRKFLRSLPKKQPKNLEAMFPNANTLALDLLKKLTVFDPLRRITVEGALKHPYLAALHFPEDEPVAQQVSGVEFEFEKYPLSLAQLKDLVYEEILLYHFPEFKKEYLRRVKAGENPFKEVINNENALQPGERDSDEDEEVD
jgi:serine/threonine protein kinase